MLLGLALSTLGILLTPQLLYLAGTQEEYYRDALVYLRIYLAGLKFTVIYNNGAGVLRAVGNTEAPFRILALSCGVNTVLDVLLVWALRLSVAGVGLATVCSQMVSVALVYRAINRTQGVRGFDLHGMYRHGKARSSPCCASAWR